MRTTLLLAASSLAVLVVCPVVASADVVSFTSLPVNPPTVHIPTTSTPAPDRIAAGEHADGVYTAVLPLAMRQRAEDEGTREVVLFTSEKEAQAYAADGTLSNNATVYDSTTPRTCLSRWGSMTQRLTFSFRTKPYVAPKPTPAQIQQLIKLHRWPPPKPVATKPVNQAPPKDSVYPVHFEHLSAAGDTVTLDTVDLFLDVQTMGTRLVSKASEKLGRVAQGPNGLGVYAARDDKGASDFLVTSPDLPQPASPGDRRAQVSMLGGMAGRLIAQIPGSSASSGCGYVRFAMMAKPGSGQMATVLASAFLPPAPDPSDADNTEPPTPSEGEDDADVVREQLERQARANRSQRSRPIAVNVSLSQLTSEASPLLSVTFGWAGKDQRIAF